MEFLGALFNGDVMKVDWIQDKLRGLVEVAGNAKRPGRQEWNT